MWEKNVKPGGISNEPIIYRKDMSDDTEQVHNESIDMNYLIKRYMNIAPTGHNISFTEQ